VPVSTQVAFDSAFGDLSHCWQDWPLGDFVGIFCLYFYSILLAIGWLREKLRPRYVYLDFSAFCTFSTMSIEPIRYPSIYDFSLIYLI
jgi:hypothetical protein